MRATMTRMANGVFEQFPSTRWRLSVGSMGLEMQQFNWLVFCSIRIKKLENKYEKSILLNYINNVSGDEDDVDDDGDGDDDDDTEA